MKIQSKSLGQILLQSGRLSPEQLQQALTLQEQTREPLGKILTRLGFVREQDVYQALEGVTVLTFFIAGEAYAFEAVRIREILKASVLQPLPADSPRWLGFFHLRGRVIPVLSLRRLLQVKAESPEHWWIVLEHGDREYAVAVEKLEGVSRWKPQDLLPVPPYLAGVRQELFLHLLRRGKEVVSLIAADRLISPEAIPDIEKGEENG